nr:hypothetical protein [Acidimicrobiia bacterium]
VFRTVWPPGLAVLGTLPLLAARAAERGVSDPPPLSAATTVAVPLLILAGVVGGWVRFRDDIHAWIKTASEQMSPTKAVERAAAEREAAEGESEGEAGPLPSDDLDETDHGDDEVHPSKGSAKPKPRPLPKAKPKPAEPTPGFRGGTSAKPMGRKRDQNR